MEWNLPVSEIAWRGIARRVARKLGRMSAVDRDDARGYANLGMMLAAREFRPGLGGPGTYLEWVGLWRAWDQMRKDGLVFREGDMARGKRPWLLFDPQGEELQPALCEGRPWSRLEQEEWVDIVRRVTTDLEAAVFRVVFVGGAMQRRVAELLGANEATVSLIVKAALDKARPLLRAYFRGENVRGVRPGKSPRNFYTVHAGVRKYKDVRRGDAEGSL